MPRPKPGQPGQPGRFRRPWPVQPYIVPNNKHTVTVILATFGNNLTTSFALGLEEQLP